jgi:gas vesicle protein
VSGGPGFLSGALLGGVLGAGLAALLAPRSGAETRRRLAEWREAQRASPQASSPPDELLQLGGALIHEIIERVELAGRAAREARDDSRQQLTAEWEASIRGEGGELAKHDG